MKNTIKVVAVVGPTATGKTSLAVKLARIFDGEIISADSRQVYKGLDIGTGKDLEEYTDGGCSVKYHLIDILSPEKEYNLKQFNLDAKNLIFEITSREKLPMVVGGSALYLDSLFSDYEFPLAPPNLELRNKLKNQTAEQLAEYLSKNYPEIFNQVDNKNSRPRLIRVLEEIWARDDKNIPKFKSEYPKIEWLILGTFYRREEVHKRIEKRLDERLKGGMIEEIEHLHEQGVSWKRLDSFGLEYRYLSRYLKGEIDYETMRNNLLANIRRLARSQDIWFRKIEKKGHKIYWLVNGDVNKATELTKLFLNESPLPEPELKLKDIYYGPKS